MSRLFKVCLNFGWLISVAFVLPSAPAQQIKLKQIETGRQKQKSDMEILVAGNNAFAFDLYARLKEDPAALKPDGNLFFSPYSISTALAMTYAGARTDTEKEMARVLHFTLGQERQHQAFSQLQIQLNQARENKLYQLSVANALWGQTGSNFLPEYIALNRKCYQAEVRELDFRAEAEKARQIINDWVEKKTLDKIKELIARGALDEAELVLTNAVYFKADWLIQFDEKNTRDMPFLVTPDKKVDVPMMYMAGEFNHFADEQVQVLEMPYKARALSMIVLLPRQIDGLTDLEKILSPKNLDKWIKGMQKRKLPVYLPKFKMTWGTYELKKTLMGLGMKLPFSPAADFSGIDGTGGLLISQVLHKTFVEVNEKGTEAAAATAVIMKRGGSVFHANHPFVFLIRDNAASSILFMGRVANPIRSNGPPERISTQVSCQGKTYPLYPKTLEALPVIPSPYTTKEGVEILIAFTKDNKCVLIPVTVENGNPLLYSRRIPSLYALAEQSKRITPSHDKDEEAIRQTLRLYERMWPAEDLGLLDKVFHPMAMLCWQSENPHTQSREDFREDLRETFGRRDYRESKIYDTQIDIAEDVATLNCKEKHVFNDTDIVDHYLVRMILLKSNESWQILTKVTARKTSLEFQYFDHPLYPVMDVTGNWGGMVLGLRCRLRPFESEWKLTETPTLILDLKSRGENEFSFVPLAQAHCQIEVDGKWYGWAEPLIIDSPVWSLKPGDELYDALEIKLTDSWALPKDGKEPEFAPGIIEKWGERLQFSPGKHIVRIRFYPNEWLRKGEITAHMTSNPVEIQVQPKPKSGN